MTLRSRRGAAAATRIALVAPTARDARAAAARLRRDGAPDVSLAPTTVSGYLASCDASPPAPVMLAGGGRDRGEDRRFFREARARLLWKTPAPDVYDAISGLRTDLPARGRRSRRPGEPSRAGRTPHLLLEGDVNAARARRALGSPARDWIVEHVGRVEMSDEELALLAERGVRWWVLWPVRLVRLRPRASARASARRRRSSRR